MSLTRKGASGVAAIRSMMTSLRRSPPRELAGDAVVGVVDYDSGAGVRGLPRSDVIALELASGSRIIARPSGTEPKAKFYFDVRQATSAGPGDVAAARQGAGEAMQRLREAFLAQLERGPG